MEQIIIREAKFTDIKSIQCIHRNCDDPWHDEVECAAWINKRLERGFYIQVAQCGEEIVGHAEWIISDEPDKKMLYLGLLQIDSDFQKRGIGRAMIRDGIHYAKDNNCSVIVTVPEMETGSNIFYEKCSFIQRRNTVSCTVSTQKGKDFKCDMLHVESVPFSVIHEKPFVFGLAQIASRHMWEICNNKPISDDRKTPTVCLCDDSYIQLSYFDNSETALALCWTKSNNLDFIIKSILFFGHECGVKNIGFVFFKKNKFLFKNVDFVDDNIEMIKLID